MYWTKALVDINRICKPPTNSALIHFTMSTYFLYLSSNLHADVLMLLVPLCPLPLLSAPTLSPLLFCLGPHLLEPLSPPHPVKGPAHWPWSRHSSLSQAPGRPRSCMIMMPTIPASFPSWLMRYRFNPHIDMSVIQRTLSDFLLITGSS